jgi:hypothetical protein
MKKFLAVFAALFLFAGIAMYVAAPQAQAAPDGPNASQVCHQVEAAFPGLFARFFDSHGDCVSSLRANNEPVKFCKALEPLWPLFDVKNLGECVSFFRTIE